MYQIRKYAATLSIALYTLLLGVPVPAQGPPPAMPAGTPTKIVSQPSIRGMEDGERFTSTEGRYSIALPKSINGFAALSPKDLGFNANGSSVHWRLREGFVVITFVDFMAPNFSLKTEQDYVDYFAGIRNSTLATTKGKLISSESKRLGEWRGQHFVFELPDGKRMTIRSYHVNGRAYSITGFASKLPEAESLLAKAFDSFQLIPPANMDAEIKRRLDTATPAALPQTPIAKKERSDAQDDNLKGKVKSVVEETEDRSGTWGTQGRQKDSVAEYDVVGNLLKRVDYDSKGKPFQVTVYGYLDGNRVSKYGTIDYEDDPPLMVPGFKEPAAPRDTRYSTKYAFKYVDGRLNERQLIHNNGKNGMRYVTIFKGDQHEELVYDEEGKLNMKFVYRLDKNGDAVERTDVDVLGMRGRDEHYLIKYESYDSNGNWTKKVTFKLVNEAGKQIAKDCYVTYRTVSYY